MENLLEEFNRIVREELEEGLEDVDFSIRYDLQISILIRLEEAVKYYEKYKTPAKED